MDEQFDDHGLELMGSELMGGAPLPPMSPVERQRYIDGITLRAKYIGTIEVPEPRGMTMMTTAIERVRAVHRTSKEEKQKQWFVVSTSGIKVVDCETNDLRYSFSLSQISFIAALPSNKKVFAFVSVNDSVRPFVFKCHVFKSSKKSLMITETIGRCFTLAVELQRQKRIQERQAQMQKSASMRPQTSPAVPILRMPDTFEDVMDAMKATLGKYTLNPHDSTFLRRGFDELARHFNIVVRAAEAAEGAAHAAHREKLEVQRRLRDSMRGSTPAREAAPPARDRASTMRATSSTNPF